MSTFGLLGRAAAAPGVALACLAVATALDAQTFQHETSLPIEITADTLEVVQADQVAIFTGNVDAVQGDLVLRADKLRVHYRGEQGGQTAGDTGSIRRIEATGNVFLSSPRETAEGDVGVYDVASSSMTLDGTVVLTRDENVIHGRHLEIDLVTGRARVTGAGTETAGAEAGERVRAIFTPADDAQDEPDEASAGDAPADASSPNSDAAE